MGRMPRHPLQLDRTRGKGERDNGMYKNAGQGKINEMNQGLQYALCALSFFRARNQQVWFIS